MTDLADLLQQSHQIIERIRLLAEEHRTLRIKYQLLIEQDDQGIVRSALGRPSPHESTDRDTRLIVKIGPVLKHALFWK